MIRTLLTTGLFASLLANAYLWSENDQLEKDLFEQTLKTMGLRLSILEAKGSTVDGQPSDLALDRLYWQEVGRNAKPGHAYAVHPAALAP